MDNGFNWIQSLSEFRFKRLTPCMCWAAGASLIVGFVCHIASVTGWITNWDVILHKITLYDYSVLTTQGKPLFKPMIELLGWVNIGSLNSVMAIGFIAVAAAFIAKILNITKPVTAVLTGAVMVAFPSVMCTFAYEMENVFFFTMLLAVVGTYFARKEGKHRVLSFILSVAFLTFSLLIYQAYIGVAAAILIFLCLYELLFTDAKKLAVLRRGLRYIAILLLSCGLYYVIFSGYAAVRGIELSSYRGIDRMGSFDLAQMPSLIWNSWKAVGYFFYKDAFGSETYLNFRWLYRAAAGLFALFILIPVIRGKLYKKPVRLLMILAMLLLLPLGMHSIAVLGQNLRTHWLMKYSFVTLFIFVLVLAEKNFLNVSETPPKNRAGYWQAWLSPVAWLLIAVQIFQWGVLTNAGYTRLRTGYEAGYAVAVQVKTDLTNVESFTQTTPVLFVEPLKFVTYDQFYYMQPYTGVSKGENFYKPEHFPNLMRCYLGTDYPSVDKAQRDELMATQEFRDMPCYPDHGYIRAIDGVVVVKFGTGWKDPDA